MIATLPLTILVDDREKAPYSFNDLGEVAVVRQRLFTGDYSLPFLTDRVAVSRKNLLDLYATVLSPERRQRFIEELRRMSEMEAALVVVEEDWQVDAPPAGFSREQRAVVVGWAYWWAKSSRPEWRACEGRRDAEVQTFAFLMAAREQLGREKIKSEGQRHV